MSDNDQATHLTISGVGTFGGEQGNRLSRVESGNDADYALMHSGQLMECAHELTLAAATGQGGTLTWASHYLSGMAKALAEDVAHSMMMQEG